MDIYIDLVKWELHLSCENEKILERVCSLFQGRTSNRLSGGKPVLNCAVIISREIFNKLIKDTVFDGPEVNVSTGVKINYSLSDQKTLFYVTNTAIAEIDIQDIYNTRIYIDSIDEETACKNEIRMAEPEAFLYPLLAEWLRYFDACFIHCGAVVIHDKTVVLSGPPGSGKSTNVIRLMNKGALFLADDLAILHKCPEEGLRMLPLRAVANVNRNTIEDFPDLAYLRSAPLRGDGKYCVNIPEYFGMDPVRSAAPGYFIRLVHDDDPWMRELPHDSIYDNIHAMAWFVSRPELTEAHFSLVAEWLEESSHWCVSQGYIRNNIDELIEKIHNDAAKK